MAESNLNDEVIKIFIESWLVKYENFVVMQHSIEKSFNGFKIGFRLNCRVLELFAIDDYQVLEKVQIVDMKEDKCIAFATKAYLVFHNTICEIKKNH